MKYVAGLYAIRNKETGFFLPASTPSKKHTTTEPAPAHKSVPRLFKEKRHAEMALKWWVKGIWKGKTITDYGENDFGLVLVPQRNRKKYKMEIVIVELHCGE